MPTNFQTIIMDLRKAGWTHSKIADHVGVSRTYITQIANGDRNNPGYDLGRKLVGMHLLVKP